jgi:Fur family transcriptional regulator, ferric uptake regulator
MKRDTAQRRAIREVFRSEARPLSPEEVLLGGQGVVPSLGIATVYRNIKALMTEGWLQTVELPGESARYELSERPHHHHFVCKRCDQAFDIEACPSDVEGLAPAGYLVEDHEVTLYGRCPACA